MDSTIRQQYLTIGLLQSTIARSENFTEAIHDSIHIMINESRADYAAVWYFEDENEPCIRPNYWVAPVDFYSRSYIPGQGIIGRVFENDEAVRLLNYKENPDEEVDSDWSGVEIGSMVCVPMSSEKGKLGVIQFIRTAEHSPFTDDEADICEILSMLTSLAIMDNHLFQSPWHPGKEIIKINGLEREFVSGGLRSKVLKGINLNVYEGEFLVLLGESGCGKSTLLNIIGGLDSPTAGTISYMDNDLTHATEEQLTLFRRDNVGFIFQAYNLMPNLNAKQNLDLIGELVEDPLSSEEALNLVGLGGKEGSYPSQLSGGQQQRISIARALVKKPKLILADEPTAALDYATSIEVLSVLEKVLTSGTTMVMVTHNEEITKMADRVVRIRNGRVFDITVNRWRLPASELVW